MYRAINLILLLGMYIKTRFGRPDIFFFLPIRSRYSIRDLVPTGCVKIVVANIELYLPGSCYMFWVNHILLINVSKVVLVVPSYVRNWSKPFDLCFMYQNEYCDLIISRLQYAHMQSRLDTM